VGSVGRAGSVVIRYGTTNGLNAELRVAQGIDGPEASDFFGIALAAVDFNRDGFDDLAVGAPNESVGALRASGAVNVYFGMPGHQFGTELFLHQDSYRIVDSSEVGDFFGYSLGTGDFNGDGYPDLAVGIPFEDVSSNTITDGGAVALFAGAWFGITPDGNRLLLPATRQVGAQFGLALRR
jgi:hypothetical protein